MAKSTPIHPLYSLTGIALTLALISQPPTWAKPPQTYPQQIAQVTPTTLTGQLDETSPQLEDGSYFNSHPFEGIAGETLLIDLVSEAFDAYLLLLGPDGTTIAEDDEGGSNSNARLALTLPATGTYQIIANTYRAGATGQYTLSFRPATAEEIAQNATLQQATALAQQIIKLYQAGRYTEAIPLAEAALQLREAALGETHPDVATSLNNLALLYQVQGDNATALPLYQRALNILEATLGETHPDIATSLSNLAELYRDQGNYAAALPLYQRTLNIFETALGETHPDVAISLNNLAGLYTDQGNYTAALPLYQRALSIFEATLGQTHPNVATSLNNLAELYRKQGNYATALPLYQRALNIYETALGETHPDVAASLNNLAELYREQGNYTAALPLYQRALNIYETTLGKNHPLVATSLNNLALIYRDQGDYATALTILERALSIRETTLGENHPLVAASLNNLATLYADQGNYAATLPLLQRARNIYETTLGENHPNVATSLNNLALIYLAQGNYTAALPLYQRALNIYETNLGKNHPDVATSLNNLAALYQAQGNYAAALPLYQRALNIYETTLGENHPDVATSLNNLATLHRAQGNYAAALPLYQRALSIYETTLGETHPDIANSLNNLAVLYQAQGNTTEAITQLQAGLEIEEQHLELNLANLAEVQRQAYAATLSATTDWAVSLHLQAAPEAPKAKQLALTTLLRRKGRILDAGVSSQQRLHQNLTPTDQATLDQLIAVQRQLATLTFNPPRTLPPDQYRAETQRLATEANQLEQTLAQRSASFRAEAQPVDLASVQAQIPANSVLVEYVRYQPFDAKNATHSWGEPRYAVYLLFPDGRIEAIDLGEAKAIDEAVQSFTTLLQDPSVTFEGITQIQTLIFDPIAPYLQGTEHLLISPDGQLNRIPFEALQAEPGGDYLVQQYQISYLNTGRDLVKLGIIPPSSNPALLLANPNYETASASPLPLGEGSGVRASRSETNSGNPRSNDLTQLRVSTLPGTAAEAEALRPLLPNATLLTETHATENALKTTAAPRILHIATHGFFLTDVPRIPQGRGIAVESAGGAIPPGGFNSEPIQVPVENPLLRSGLALAGFNSRRSGSEDGVLTALEASQLNLSGTQLVVLSACETGLGDITNGEGVYGLRRAFALAGAETQLMSLWQVSDYGTQTLMTRYYTNLINGMGRSEALRAVQLEMIQSGGQYSHPYYWAAFILAGNWRPLSP